MRFIGSTVHLSIVMSHPLFGNSLLHSIGVRYSKRTINNSQLIDHAKSNVT